MPKSNRGGFFHLEPNGILTTEKELSSVSPSLLPFNLTIVASDNPHKSEGDSHSTSVSVIVSFSCTVFYHIYNLLKCKICKDV